MAKVKGGLVYAVVFGVFLTAAANSDIFEFDNGQALVPQNETLDVDNAKVEEDPPVPDEISKGKDFDDFDNEQTFVTENENFEISTKAEKKPEQEKITRGKDIENEFCTSPPEIPGAISPALGGTKFANGTVVSYQCPFGHVGSSSSNLFSTCRIDDLTGTAEWTRPNVTCIPRSCGDPGYVVNGRRIGNLFTFPNKVEFKCNEGYKMKGLKERFCQAAGEWSGRIPICEPIYCSAPRNLPNGRAIYYSLEYGSELRYECNKGFTLNQNQPRFCGEDGKWSNSEPKCEETRCTVPEAPIYGSVQLAGEPVVGSLAVFSCNDDTTLFGQYTSKCLPIGVWSSNPPKCLRFCLIPVVQNGELGRYQTRRYQYRTVTDFVSFQVGKSVQHNESVAIRCNEGYMSDNSQNKVEEMFCINGSWSKILQCHEGNCICKFLLKRCSKCSPLETFGLVHVGPSEGTGLSRPTLCLQDPPPVEHGVPVILDGSRRHGSTIWYTCDEENGYRRAKRGKIECNYGKWIGQTPVCAQFRCYTNQLNYEGLKKPRQDYYNSSTSFNFECERAYTKSTADAKISCFEGKWDIKTNLCILKTCYNEPPLLTNGYSIMTSRINGSFVDYECDEGFQKVGRSSVQCEFGNWIGQPPECKLNKDNLEETTADKSTDTNGKREVSEHQDECFCTYDYQTYLLTGYLTGKILEKGDLVRKGESVTFSCKYPNMNIVWQNGMRLSNSVVLTCKTCRNWQSEDLPNCRTLQTGSSVFELDPTMEILPGGTLEVPKSSDITLHCKNQWLQPRWSSARVRSRISGRMYQSNGNFYEDISITAVDNEHSGRYECLSQDHYGTQYSSTVVDLIIAEPEIRCPVLQTITNKGNFILEYENDRKISSLVRYKCKDNSKRIVGSNQRICLNTGKWSGSFPECEDILCEPLNEGNMFVIDYNNGRRVNSVAFYYCKSQTHRLIGSSNRTCLHTGLWSGTEPVCEEITCLEFLTYNGLIVTYTDGRRVNSFARFQCTPPRSLVGESSSVCNYNGEWSYQRPSCELLDVRCPILGGRGIFTIKYIGDRKINTKAQFFCKEDNKKVEGCNFMTCQPNGEWSGDYPTCVDLVTCERFVPSTNLVVSYSDDVRVNSIASFRCKNSLKINGSSESTCLFDGSWSQPLPSCEIPQCSIDSLMMSIPESVFPDMTNVTDEFLNAGSQLLLQCEDGLIFRGNPIVTCGLDGNWEYENVQCVPGCRLSNNRPALKIEPVKNEYRFGESILLSCPPGMALSNDVERLVCLGKTWSHEMPNCTEWKDTTPSGIMKTSKKSRA